MIETPPDSRLIAPLDFYRLIRSQIEHEDNLNSQRLSWFVASQAFLFTAYAIVLSNLRPGTAPQIDHQEHLLVLVIPLVSLLTCAMIYATILAGAVAMVNLRRLYRGMEGAKTKMLPPVQGFRLTQIFGQAGPLGLPPFFMAVWILLLLQRAWM